MAKGKPLQIVDLCLDMTLQGFDHLSALTFNRCSSIDGDSPSKSSKAAPKPTHSFVLSRQEALSCWWFSFLTCFHILRLNVVSLPCKVKLSDEQCENKGLGEPWSQS